LIAEQQFDYDNGHELAVLARGNLEVQLGSLCA